MAMICIPYTNWVKNAGAKMENLSADTLKVLLMGTGYVPNFDTDSAYSLATPSAPTFSNSGTGGTVPAGTYQSKVTYVNPAGETVASTASSTTTTGSTSTLTINSPATPSPLGSVLGWYGYVTQAGGSTFYRQQTAGSPTPLGTNLVLTANPTTSGATAPTTDTADIIANEVANGNGYTTGGASLASVTYGVVLANNFTRQWAASTAYTIGQIIRPATGNGNLYECVQAGSTGSSAPTFGVARNGLTADGTVQWLCIGTSIVVLNGANITWNTGATAITWRYAVVYDTVSGDLICLLDPGSSQQGPTNGTININWDSASGVLALCPG